MSESPPGQAGRLLIVDDETALVTALTSTLRDEGYVVWGAANPADALEIVRRERLDVILTDLHLPQMDGIALLRAALEIDPTLMGILMTGHGSIDTAVDAMKAGAVDYVLKPFKLKSVLSVLSRALTVRRLRRDNEELNQRLAARSKELESANNELEAFSYSVSHDLRAPLRAIEGFTAALIDERETATKEVLEGYGERIKRGTHRMGAMIDDLLRMATAMRAELSVTEVDLGGMARDIVAHLQAQSPERKIELTVADNLFAQGDPGLVQMALENLLANAWKYTGRVEVARIEVGALDTAKGKAFFVRDNGVGFDMAEAGKLFVPFQRLRSGSKFEGTGVGLSTVQRIIRRHGGQIWAEATLDKGATFLFTLPRPSGDKGPA